MDLRVAPVTAPAGPGLPLPGGSGGAAGVVGPIADGGPPAGGWTPGPALGPGMGSAQAILAGLTSPLAHAGLLPTAGVAETLAAAPALPPQHATSPATWAASGAAALASAVGSGWPALAQARADMPAPSSTPPADAAQAVPAQGSAQPLAEPVAAQPLVPAWVTALHTPASRLGPWPQAADERRSGQGQPDHGQDPESAPAEAQPDTENSARTPSGPVEERAASLPSPWPPSLDALLPPPVRAELSRRRSVLLVAPPGAAQRGLQLACLGFDGRGRPVCHRWAVRGAAPATPGAAWAQAQAQAEWQFWRVRREGDDGQRPVLNARALAPAPAGSGLVLRATATVLPPPLRPAHHGWLDVLEPQRLWRDLGSQWTVLLAWSPHPLPLDAA